MNDQANRKPRGRGRDAAPEFVQTGEALIEKLVGINRVAKVVKGGRNFSFNAIAIVGDGKGRAGFGLGKANEVVEAIRKATERARRAMHPVTLSGTTIPHEVNVKFGGARIMLKPASPGTGEIPPKGAGHMDAVDFQKSVDALIQDSRRVPCGMLFSFSSLFMFPLFFSFDVYFVVYIRNTDSSERLRF